MSYQPVSGIVPQYSNDSNELASGFYLKFYIANTTTPLSMATDSNGGTLLVKAKLNPDGLPISNPLDNDTVFIPHVDQDYRLVIYRNEADADANNTAGSFLNVPSLVPMQSINVTTATGTQTVGAALDDRVVNVNSVSYGLAQLDESLQKANMVYRCKGWHRNRDYGGGDFYWDAGRAKSVHDGIKVISPTVPDATAQAGATDAAKRDNFLAGTGETDSAGTGCFVRVDEGDADVKIAGAYATGVAGQEDTGASDAMVALFPGRIIAFPAGTYRGNFVFDDNTRILGGGQNATVFLADNTSLPIVTHTDATAIEQYYINAKGFMIDGESTATLGWRFGNPDQSESVSYGVYTDVEVKRCATNIEMNRVIGFNLQNIYSHAGSISALSIPSNDIVTTGTFINCQFRQSVTGLDLRGGSLINFYGGVVESNLDVGLFFSRISGSGARQVTFYGTWFENNGYSPSTVKAGGVYIDMEPSLGTSEYPSNLAFVRCVLQQDPAVPEVQINRGNQILFDTCAFRDISPTYLQVNTGSGYAYAMLKNCGTINGSPNPTLYANMPALVKSGEKYLGYAYEYEYEGAIYRNFGAKIRRISATTSSIDVTGSETLVADTSAGNVEITSLANGHDGQELRIIKPSSANTLTVKHNGAGSQPIFMPNTADVGLTARQGYILVCEQGTWYAPLRS